MFTKVRLQNFRSFGEIEFNLLEKKNDAKRLAVVFGENGAGKSNLMSAFVMLSELLATLDMRDAYEDFLSQKAIFNNENIEKAYKQRILDRMRDMRAIIDDCRMVGSTKPILVEFDFLIGDNSGRYVIELGTEEIIHERLEYRLNKRRAVYFDCTKEKFMINPSIVKEKDLLSDIKASAKRFWGKHSLLAIITYEKKDKSHAYGEDNISDNFDDVIAEFTSISCYVKIGRRLFQSIYSPMRVMESPTSGSIPASLEGELAAAEAIFTSFFSAVNSDIKSAFYKVRRSENRLYYELYFRKLIAGEYRDIEFSRESTGNHQLIETLCYLLTACFGGVVILDEADSGIHDILFKKILQEILPSITGQLIMTTHNSVLMETEFAHSSTYILSEDENGNKNIRTVSDYEKRTFYANNIRNKYLNNEYGGIPAVASIDFINLTAKIEEYNSSNR